jgi:hypothetical protein
MLPILLPLKLTPDGMESTFLVKLFVKDTKSISSCFVIDLSMIKLTNRLTIRSLRIK